LVFHFFNTFQCVIFCTLIGAILLDGSFIITIYSIESFLYVKDLTLKFINIADFFSMGIFFRWTHFRKRKKACNFQPLSLVTWRSCWKARKFQPFVVPTNSSQSIVKSHFVNHIADILFVQLLKTIGMIYFNYRVY